MIELIGSLLILSGAVFLFSAGLGLVRMPDPYTRIQAGTKATTLGNILIVVGLAFYHPEWTPKLALVIFFVLMTNPVSSHALSRAAHRIRTPMAPATVTDALADDGKTGQAEDAV
jgi:multicomponent Na+:H+ antiporter subunit G